MSRAEVLAAVLAEHQRVVIKPHGPCHCGAWPTEDHFVTWMDHVAAALDAALAQEGDQGEAVREALDEARRAIQGATQDSSPDDLAVERGRRIGMQDAERIVREVRDRRAPQPQHVTP